MHPLILVSVIYPFFSLEDIEKLVKELENEYGRTASHTIIDEPRDGKAGSVDIDFYPPRSPLEVEVAEELSEEEKKDMASVHVPLSPDTLQFHFDKYLGKKDK